MSAGTIDAGPAAIAAELGSIVALLDSIDQKLRDAIARPAFDQTFTVVSVSNAAFAETLTLGKGPGLLLCRVWQTHRNLDSSATDASAYVLRGDQNAARCAAILANSGEVDGVFAVPAAGVAEFLLDGTDKLTVYFDEALTSASQAVSVRVTSLERYRA